MTVSIVSLTMLAPPFDFNAGPVTPPTRPARPPRQAVTGAETVRQAVIARVDPQGG